MKEKTKIVPTVLCGGSGTRLWPLSRDLYPKQFHPIAGRETMLQATLSRLEGFAGDVGIADKVIVLCNEDHRFLVAEQIKQGLGLNAAIILEPFGRNTAPALTVAALYATEEGDDPLLLVMPADHVIADKVALHKAINSGIREACSGAIVTFGIVPLQPETGYGYIQSGAPTGISETGFNLKRFVEKPDRETAARYIAGGDYYWNSGLFLMAAGVWLRLMACYQPEMLSACRSAYMKSSCDSDYRRLDRASFAVCPADSIDYAVMEKLSADGGNGTKSAVVPLAAGWSDVGAWDAVWGIAPKDVFGNVSSGDVLLEDTRDSLVFSTSRLVACVGLEKLIVVETPDAVLVVEKEKVQDVKKVVAELKSRGRDECANHRRVYRPWGWYESIEKAEHFQVKRISVNPGALLSLQMHHHRNEHWIVVRGTAKVTCGDEIFLLPENQSAYIPSGQKHRLENQGEISLEIIEVQYGSYFGEDDIVRFEDQYGRETEK